MQLTLAIIFALLASVTTVKALELFGLSPQHFVDRVNQTVLEGGGDTGFASLGQCRQESFSCELSAHGVVIGTFHTTMKSTDIEAITLSIQASDDMNGVFFAALSAAMGALTRDESTADQQRAAMLKIVREITADTPRVIETVGRFRFLVRVTSSRIIADISVAEDFNALQRLFSP